MLPVTLGFIAAGLLWSSIKYSVVYDHAFKNSALWAAALLAPVSTVYVVSMFTLFLYYPISSIASGPPCFTVVQPGRIGPGFTL